MAAKVIWPTGLRQTGSYLRKETRRERNSNMACGGIIRNPRAAEQTVHALN